MAEIKLTRNKIAIVDDEELLRCLAYNWRARHGKTSRPDVWYAETWMRDESGRRIVVGLHRFILGAPKGIDIDHRDGDGLNNRRSNLRLATASQNHANMVKQRRMSATSQFKGVTRSNQQIEPRPNSRWEARIKVNRQKIYLGVFSSEMEAAQAYDCAAVLYFGDFAKPNFGTVGVSGL
jgi:hypothetical protein